MTADQESLLDEAASEAEEAKTDRNNRPPPFNFPHAKPPMDSQECPEAIWSLGCSCRRCDRRDCYRAGWSQAKVGKDNPLLSGART